jgi:hypothetical protein
MRKTGSLAIISILVLAGCETDAPQRTQAAAAVPPPPAAEAPRPTPGQVWDVTKFRCDQLIGLADDDRAAAAMFYYGYLAASARIVMIDASHIEPNIARVMDQCVKTPNATVPQAFRQALAAQPR